MQLSAVEKAEITMGKLDDLVGGRGRYALMSLEDRQNILRRYDNTMRKLRKERKLKEQAVLDTEYDKIVLPFINQGSPIFQVLSRFEIIEPKQGNRCYYNESLKRIKDLFGSNGGHLYPYEAFMILIDWRKQQEQSPSAGIAENMWNGNGEWLDIAFKKEGNTLFWAFNPHILAWDEKQHAPWDDKGKNTGDYVEVNGKITPAGQADIGTNGNHQYTIKNLPEAAHNIFGNMNFNEIPGNPYLWVWTEPIGQGKWRPVGRGSYVDIFYLGASDLQRASRGVRRK